MLFVLEFFLKLESEYEGKKQIPEIYYWKIVLQKTSIENLA